MKTKKSRIVKAIRLGNVEYFDNPHVCCNWYGIRYQDKLFELIENGGLAPDGRTFFDWPTDLEIEQINRGEILTIS